jgi:outer membrane receptor protein involved in Fe transport
MTILFDCKKAGLLILCAALGGLAVPAAMAQENTGATIEEVVVTGSRIKRQDEVANSPVQTLSEDDLRIDGSLSIGETLQSMPSVGSSLNSNGSAGTSHGASSINLRNLGENRSLVLVNGHRWVNGAGTRGFRDFVDMNTIPQAMIQRVEVLQDGATAIYGADAIAGVVNLHTYKDFEGFRAKAYYGSSSEGDRDTANIDVLFGTDIGNTNLMLAATHVDQDPIYTQDRKLTAIPLNGLSVGTPEGLFRESGLAAVVDFPVPSAGITRDPGTDGSVIANWRAVDTSTDTFNRYYNNYVVGPLERTSLFLQSRTALSDTLVFSVEALYNERKSDQLFSSALSVVRGGSRGFVIVDDPAVNPFGITFSGSDFRVDGFMEENGQRDNVQDVETTRIGLGLEGQFGNDWSWDSFLSFAENEATFTSVNQVDLDRLALGLRNCDSSGIEADISDIEAGCVPVNLFNPLTSMMVDYINFTGQDRNKAETTDFTFNVTGDLLDMPAGPLAFAAGYEYRKELGLDKPDSYINSDPRVNTYRATTSAPRDGTDADYDLNELYVEFSIPLLADKPGARSLVLDLATRYSDYSTFGDTTNSKVGLGYRPVESLLVRATWAEGFRAPSLLELYEGTRATSIPVTDPCSGGGAGLPGCAGVPPTYVQIAGNAPATVGGNPTLQPETSENVSFGFVLAPESLPGFSLTADWYDIEIENTISEYGAQNLLDLCAVSGQRCNFIERDASGEITNVIDGPINLNSTSVKGMDIVGRYAFEIGDGDLDLTLSMSKLDELIVESTLSDGSILVEDKGGTSASRESYPDWRGLFRAQWQSGPWAANYSARYIGSTTEYPGAEARNISSVTYHNIAGMYDFSDSMSLRVGIDNLADKQPPSSLTNTNINFDQNTYNPVGRFWYVQFTYDADM